MALQRNIPHITPAPARQRRADMPRLFTLEYDNSRVKSANPQTRAAAREKQFRWGVLWPEGGVSLSSQGNYYTSLVELRLWLEEHGAYELRFLDEEDGEARA